MMATAMSTTVGAAGLSSSSIFRNTKKSSKINGRGGVVRVNAVAADWREKAKPIQPGSGYPAKEHCSQCGLCDTYYVVRRLYKLTKAPGFPTIDLMHTVQCDILVSQDLLSVQLVCRYVAAHVKDACAFLGDGMSRIETMAGLALFTALFCSPKH
jgi:hypothetical protein